MKTTFPQRTLHRALAFAFACLLLVNAQSYGLIVFTIENPGVQQTTVAGAVTETFDTHALGAMGTFNSPTIPGTFTGGSVLVADQYGGANGTRYDLAASGVGSSSTLTLNTPQKYIGLWWSAGDAGNILEFYDSSATLLSSFSTASILGLLPATYRGNPNPPAGRNTGEAYAYLNFTATGSDSISRVVFRQTTGGGFEIDNVSVFDQPITPPGHTLPEGGPLIPVMTGAVIILALVRRKMKCA